jgi:hypothetical protein
MTRLPSYLAYHQESARIGDIDPSHAMLRYVCNRFELNTEQRYWLAFLYAMTYCGASVYYVYNEFPDFENVNLGRLDRWWKERGREAIICQTDRRWVRSLDLMVPAVASYQSWVGKHTQHERLNAMARGATPEARYDALLSQAKVLHSFGQFALFLYLEALHTITPLDLEPTDLDLNQAWSCRNGLCYAYGLDQYLTDEGKPTPPQGKSEIQTAWLDLRQQLRVLPTPPTVWNTETMLCAYKKWHRGKRYVGFYLDRQAIEIAKMEDHVKDGVCWDVLWDYRAETYQREALAEMNGGVTHKGVSSGWKYRQITRTKEVTGE